MIDLETLGQSANSVILTFAAVAFDTSGTIIGQDFYRRVDISSYEKYGQKFAISFSTLSWWMTNAPSDARNEAFNLEDRHPIEEVITEFLNWWRTQNGTIVWSHGASFDIPIVDYTVATLLMKVPWNYTNIRDTRTLYDLIGIRLAAIPRQIALPEHHALSDCYRQIHALKICFDNMTMQEEVVEVPVAVEPPSKKKDLCQKVEVNKKME